ncbi:ABC transporter ATP-binding protein [Bradyrhizobium sp. 1]|uniref:ABC transporter ATP-binding protein n=1 Tax=Bradyrhizobium sp. 1 TaxID=241591 RepID=UPI001FFC0110|nr:ABC transporter ATP-binding protein [Bradyrhizobium sp. 1]MCK1394464.1 ABC transporter ATP-binding protein [Bradyrhizobium sp. 1]
MTSAILDVANIETHYGPIAALRGISLAVEEGKITTILGSNGAGKTTVLKTIAGALDPTRGQVRLQGQEIQGMAPDAIARKGIAHVPEGREIFPFLSVGQNLMMGAYARSDRSAMAADLDRVLSYFPRLVELRTRAAGTLSGGEQQMVAIGRALMSRPRVLLLDEPSLGLSPRLVKEVLDVIVRINRDDKLSVLLVEQNVAQALQIAHYGYVMELGRVVMADTCDQLRTKADIQEFYLGMRADDAGPNRRWKKKTWR